ncbi:MAG: AAA family ATPase [Sulfurifustis sp.]
MSDVNPQTATSDQAQLIARLIDPLIYGLPATERVETLETHISHVLLAGPYAYKIKKAVSLGFLDFRTLSARRFYCDEELRLNRRLAPTLYLDVVPITGTPDRPVLAGDGAAIEYAVRMRRFSQECLLDRLAARGALTPAIIDQLAMKTAEFHRSASVSTDDDGFGTVDTIQQPALDNFVQIRATMRESSPDFDALERWTSEQCAALAKTFQARKRNGFVRECHGDLHLRNVALVDGDVTLFDCIEFDPNLRWIDVMNDVAFMTMDLHDRKQPALARRFLNHYLEISGDYAGLRVLVFYAVYRALVRAKIHGLRAQQPNLVAPERARLLNQYRGYLALARAQTQARPPFLLITHGFSGSGKTTCTQPLVESLGAVRVRSDIERKRLLGFAPLARTGSAVEEGAYAGSTTARTYERLAELAETIIDAGVSVIVDATFLKRTQRDIFRQLAQTRRVPFVILSVVADETVMRARISERQRRPDASEADLDVLQHQLTTHEPLEREESSLVVTYDSTRPPAAAASLSNAVLAKLGRDRPTS